MQNFIKDISSQGRAGVNNNRYSFSSVSTGLLSAAQKPTMLPIILHYLTMSISKISCNPPLTKPTFCSTGLHWKIENG
jgi:hypothetical protein